MKRNKILITGGAGYIGALLSEKLIEEGFPIRIFDKFYFGNYPVRHLTGKAEIIQGDIREIQDNLFDNVHAIIHLAALSNDPTAEFNPKANFAINTEATFQLAKKAKEKGVERFIFASSCSIYDLGVEKENGLKTEDYPVDPIATYSLSKHAAEEKLISLSDENFCVIIFRKGTVFGFSPRMRYDLVVNAMVKNAIANGVIRVFCHGNQWRPLVAVEDVVRAYLLGLKADAKKVNGHIINISLDNFLIKDIAHRIQQALKKNFAIQTVLSFEEGTQKDRSYRVSKQKAKDLLGFVGKVSIEDSVKNIVIQTKQRNMRDFDNPIYYNILWMKPIFEKEQEGKFSQANLQLHITSD